MKQLTYNELQKVTGGEMECYCKMMTGNIFGGEEIITRDELGDVTAKICEQACCGSMNTGWEYRGDDSWLSMDEITFDIVSKPLADKGRCR